MTNFDITAIVNGHREGLMAASTIRSIEQALVAASSEGISVEVIAVLDLADDLTASIFDEWVRRFEHVTVCNVEYGDLGLSRNHGVALARGKWVAFLDADDLWSADWLTSAYRSAEAERRVAVWHPQSNLFFGTRPHVFLHIDMDEPTFDLSSIVETNLWTALAFTSRELLQQVPYKATNHLRQIGYEDWGWNINTIAHGAVHKTVAGTVHAVRTKALSLVSKTSAARCLPYPTNHFRSILSGRR